VPCCCAYTFYTVVLGWLLVCQLLTFVAVHTFSVASHAVFAHTVYRGYVKSTDVNVWSEGEGCNFIQLHQLH